MSLRVLGAAIGAAIPTVITAILVANPFFAPVITLVGAPIGAGVGFVSAPWLISASPPVAFARATAAALTATVLGLVVLSAWQFGSEFALPFTTALYVYSGAIMILGFPPALVVSLIATFALRRLAGHADRWWTVSVGVLVACGLACILMLPPVISPDCDGPVTCADAD